LTRIPATEKYVDDWLHNLPVIWMTVVVFGVTYFIAAAIYAVVMVLATGVSMARGISPIMAK
jgi:hypothetical protein